VWFQTAVAICSLVGPDGEVSVRVMAAQTAAAMADSLGGVGWAVRVRVACDHTSAAVNGESVSVLLM
jgi:hypothetical protein